MACDTQAHIHKLYRSATPPHYRDMAFSYHITSARCYSHGDHVSRVMCATAQRKSAFGGHGVGCRGTCKLRCILTAQSANSAVALRSSPRARCTATELGADAQNITYARRELHSDRICANTYTRRAAFHRGMAPAARRAFYIHI